MYIRRRQVLVAMLVMSQLGCMTFGVLWASQWLHEAFSRIVHNSASLQAETIALETARRLSGVDLSTTESQAATDQFRQLCNHTAVPHDGFLSIVSLDHGTVLASSLTTPLTAELDRPLGEQALVLSDETSQTLSAAVKQSDQNRRAVTGSMELNGRQFDVTALAISDRHAAIVVAFAEDSVDHLVSELITPLIHVGFVLTGAVVGATALCTIFLVRRFDSTLLEVSSSLEREVDRRTLSLQRTRNAVVFGLSKLAESRDKDAGQHLERLRTYVTILASEMAKHNPKIDHHYVANLAIASALHDVGKMGVPDAVILKLGKLTAAERRAMQMHTVLGDECLAAVERMLGDHDQFLTLSREVAAAHHEQWDGSGYPYGLQGKDIPLAARIVALADVYDALTSHRQYRPAATHAEAREWIVSHYGSQFDPEVVEAFVAREGDFAKISYAAAQLEARQSPAEAAAIQSSPAAELASQR